MKHDMFMELPVSLVLFSLICMDVVERLRYCYLTGQGESCSLCHINNKTISNSSGFSQVVTIREVKKIKTFFCSGHTAAFTERHFSKMLICAN